MEESVSGFKVHGTWGDVVEHGERITRALREMNVHEEGSDVEYAAEFAEWDDWRPKAHERLEEEVSEKTAEQASIDEGEGEKVGDSPEEDIETAGEKLTASYEKLDDDVEEAVETATDSAKHAARAADTAGRKALRTVEETVYEQVMTQAVPYYFDNELVSTNIQQDSWDDADGFIFEVDINDDKLKCEVSERLAEYEETVDRWHVTTERETEAIEAAEGADLSETDPDDQSRPTEN